MFKGFAQVWTPVERSRRLRRRPLALTVAGERIVLFRDGKGQAAALIDRCPHRGVALSLGQVDQEGRIECPFHGWRFAGDGRCLHVPLNPKARCEQLSATALPVREIGGLIWIYTAPGAQAPCEPVLDESLGSSGFVRFVLIQHWKAHWTRAMENMLDMPHLPFVHRTTIGRDLRVRLRPDSEMRVEWEASEHGGVVHSTMDGLDGGGTLEFTRPNRMMLTIPIPGKRLRLHVACVPIRENETRMILITARDFLRWLPSGPIDNWMNARIALQDQAIVESSQPTEIPPPAQERSVASDKPTLQFRKYYFETLRESQAQLPQRLVSLGKTPPASALDA
jgi:phenylpropionate dioxygenase-like ring-hydroxylating dioxygenase large terminal subunit